MPLTAVSEESSIPGARKPRIHQPPFTPILPFLIELTFADRLTHLSVNKNPDLDLIDRECSAISTMAIT